MVVYQDYRLQIHLPRRQAAQVKLYRRNMVRRQEASGERDRNLISATKLFSSYSGPAFYCQVAMWPDATTRVSNFSRENPSLDFCVKFLNA